MSKMVLLILLVHHKFCWCILNFAGADFEVKCAPEKYMRQRILQQNLLVYKRKYQLREIV